MSHKQWQERRKSAHPLNFYFSPSIPHHYEYFFVPAAEEISHKTALIVVEGKLRVLLKFFNNIFLAYSEMKDMP
jgi:hypothetical protein